MKIYKKQTLVFWAAVVFGFGFTPFLAAAPLQNGDHGVDGDPGTHGSDGGDGIHHDVRLNPPHLFRTLNAGSGFNGGNGGQGVDGDDPDSLAAGGNGGKGGNGGHSLLHFQGEYDGDPDFSQQQVDFTARGGRGAHGGKAGLGSLPGLDGVGGHGGNGGFALASSTLKGFRAGRLKAFGGHGGDAFGVGANAGRGGGTQIRSSAEVTDRIWHDGAYRRFGQNIWQWSGGGGTGHEGANGGDAAHANLGVAPGQFQWTGTTDYELNFVARLYAGSGGRSEDGVAGLAGNAYANLTNIISGSGNRPENLNMDFDLRAGHGGFGQATRRHSVHGRHGGHASLVVSEPIYFQFGRINASLQGGQGGDALGEFNEGNGGDGGMAFVSPIEFGPAEAGNFGGEHLDLEIRGGNGGAAMGSGRGGQGANSHFYNRLTVQTKNWLPEYSVTARAGDGGSGAENGSGGNSVVALENALTRDETLPDQLRESFSATAHGGNSGNHADATNEAHGGNAWASVIHSGRGYAIGHASSFAGIGTIGTSGSSFARVHTSTTSERGYIPFNPENKRDNAFAQAHAGFQTPREFTPTRISGDAIADARATSAGDSFSIANAFAIGRTATEKAGNAMAFANSINVGTTGGAKATARSSAQGDRSTELDQDSVAIANATAQGGAVFSFAEASSTGYRINNRARSKIVGPAGNVRAIAHSNTMAGASHSSRIQLDGTIVSEDMPQNEPTQKTVQALAYANFQRNNLASDGERNSSQLRGQIAVSPDQDFADTVAMQGSHAEVFVDDVNATIIGIGSIGASGIDGVLAAEANYDLTMRLTSDQDDANFLLGFDTMSEGDGFSSFEMVAHFDGRRFINETFSSLTDAEDFLSGALYDLGPSENLEPEINLSLDLSWSFENAQDSFDLGLIFGDGNPFGGSTGIFAGGSSFSAVPEPDSLLAGWFVLGWFVGKRRKLPKRS